MKPTKPAKLRESTREPWEKPRSKTLQTIREGLMTFCLLVLLLFVLMPMFWMVLTSFKARGTAFQFKFLPHTEFYTPEMTNGKKALPIPEVAAGESWLHAEYADTNATEVSFLLKGGSDEKKTVMQQGAGGVWFCNVKVEPGDYHYAYSVSGGAPQADPKGAGQAGTDGYTALKIQNESGVFELGSSFLVYREKETLKAKIAGIEDASVFVVLDDTREVPIKATGELNSIPVDAGVKSFRVLRRTEFGAALAKMYTTEHFRTILGSEEFDFGRFFLNSLVVATSAALLTVIICTLAGYAFSQKQFHFRDQLFTLLLASMLVPGMIFMVPQFSITLNLGMMNTYQGMVIPHLANMFGLFLMRQYITQIPKDLFAAAEIDGANEPQVFQNVVIPICMPIMVTLFLLVFVGQWSNFLWQLIVNTGQSKVITLPVGLQLFKGQNATEWEKIMAGACFSILPIAALFLTLQKYFLEGLTAGAVKE